MAEDNDEIALLCKDVVDSHSCTSKNCEGCQKIRKMMKNYLRTVTTGKNIEEEIFLNNSDKTVEFLKKTDSACFSSQNSSFGSLESDIWIIDSGASSHVTYSKEGMINLRNIDKKIKIGNGKYVNATHIGTKIG